MSRLSQRHFLLIALFPQYWSHVLVPLHFSQFLLKYGYLKQYGTSRNLDPPFHSLLLFIDLVLFAFQSSNFSGLIL